MSFARDQIAAAVATHGRVARVLLADLSGSSPREVGAAMLVWPEGSRAPSAAARWSSRLRGAPARP